MEKIPSIYASGIIEHSLVDEGQVFYETQRGCKYRCKYCVYHKNRKRISYYSVENVKADLEELICRRKITTLRFIDATFTSDLDRAKDVFDFLCEIKQKGYQIPWIYFEYTMDTIDDEFLQKVAALKEEESINNSAKLVPQNTPQLYTEMMEGYNIVNCVGLQSLCMEALKSVGRIPFQYEFFKEFMTKCKMYNLVLKVDLILGLPFETESSYLDGLNKVIPLFENTDSVLNIHVLQILPDSQLESLCERYCIEYSQTAPHYVKCTNSMSWNELCHMAKLSALVFRIINSPLRVVFYESLRTSMAEPVAFVEKVLNIIRNNALIENTIFVHDEFINDEYWNRDIYYELKSDFLVQSMEMAIEEFRGE